MEKWCQKSSKMEVKYHQKSKQNPCKIWVWKREEKHGKSRRVKTWFRRRIDVQIDITCIKKQVFGKGWLCLNHMFYAVELVSPNFLRSRSPSRYRENPFKSMRENVMQKTYKKHEQYVQNGLKNPSRNQWKIDTKSMLEKGMQNDGKMRENGARMGAKIH